MLELLHIDIDESHKAISLANGTADAEIINSHREVFHGQLRRSQFLKFCVHLWLLLLHFLSGSVLHQLDHASLLTNVNRRSGRVVHGMINLVGSRKVFLRKLITHARPDQVEFVVPVL